MSLPRPDDDKEFTMETREASPAHFLIKIESFSLLSECGIKKYETREFEAGGYRWRLIIYPDGHVSESEGNHVSVYLAMAGSSSLPVDWELEWGFSKMISKKSLTDESNGFLVDDNCVFGAEVFVIKSQKRVVECVSLLKVPNPPYKRDWKITEFSKLKVFWTSEEFTAGDHKWKIFLYPDGDTEEMGRSVSIYLECVDSKSFAPNEKVRADYCIHLKKHIQCTDNSAKRLRMTAHPGTSAPAVSHSFEDSHWFTSSSTDWGWPAFIPIAEMRDPCKGFIVDDCCFLEIQISVRAVVRNPPYPNSN